jgi:hypothetical protein
MRIVSFTKNHKPPFVLATWGVAIAMTACGGGNGVPNSVSTSVVDDGSVITDVSTVPLIAANKRAPHPADNIESPAKQLTDEELAKMEEIELTKMAEMEGKTTGDLQGVAVAKAEVAMTQGFDAAAIYTVGLLTSDLGPAGQAIINRKNSTVKQMALIGGGVGTAATLPADILYMRAGSINPKDVLSSPIFKQAVAQNRPILVEREALGRTAYENLLWNVFNFAPYGTNAVLLRSDGDNNESWEAFVVEEDDTDGNGADDSENDTPVKEANIRSAKTGNYRIDMNAIASIVKGQEIMGTAKTFESKNLGVEAPVFATAIKTKISGKYLWAQQVWVNGQLNPQKPWIINPYTWAWEQPGNACVTKGPCGAYGNTAVTYNVWGADLANIACWDDWVYCGETGPVDTNVFCETGYKKSVKKITGYTQTVGAELGLSVTAEGEVSIPFVAKTKIATTVSTKASYGKTWYDQKETTYETSYNTRIKGGYQARFGRGDWSAYVSKWLTGRHERKGYVGATELWPGVSQAETEKGCWNQVYRGLGGGKQRYNLFQCNL